MIEADGTDRTTNPYYDYTLQVWVRDGAVVDCGHPDHMRPGCCNGSRYAGMSINEARLNSGQALQVHSIDSAGNVTLEGD